MTTGAAGALASWGGNWNWSRFCFHQACQAPASKPCCWRRDGGKMPHDVAADFAVHLGQQGHEHVDGLRQADHGQRLHHGATAREDIGKIFRLRQPAQGRHGLLVTLASQGVGHRDDDHGAGVAGGYRAVQQLLQIVLGLGRIGGHQHGQQRGGDFRPAFLAAHFLVEDPDKVDANVAMLLPSQEGFIGRPLDLVLEIQQQRRGDQLGALEGRKVAERAEAFEALGGGTAVKLPSGGADGVAVCRGVVVGAEEGRQRSHGQEKRGGHAESQDAHRAPLSFPFQSVYPIFPEKGIPPARRVNGGFPAVPAVPAGRGRRAWGRSERGGAGGLRVQNRNGTRWPVRLDLRIASMITATR